MKNKYFNLLKLNFNSGVLIILLIQLFLVRSAVPFLKYPFILLYTGFLIFTLLKIKNISINFLSDFSKIFAIPLSLVLYQIFHFITSDKIYLIVFKDIVSTIILFSMYLMLYYIIDSKEKLNLFFKNLSLFILGFAILATAFTFFVQWDIFSFQDFAPKNPLINNSSKLAIEIDNNFATVPVFLGLFVVLAYVKNSNALVKILQLLLLSFFSLVIILSGSKRAMILLLIITGVFLVIKLSYRLGVLKFLNTKIQNSRANYYFLSLAILFLFSFLFLSMTDYSSKSSILRKLGTQNVFFSFNRITASLFDYVQVIKPDESYSSFHKKLWRPVFDPNDPDKGWGTRIHKTINKLTGDNVNIVPKGSKGYSLDRTCNADVYKGNAYANTLIWNDHLHNDSVTGASVYCYVSKDFNGESVYIELEVVPDTKRAFYDLTKKETWQKLSLEFSFDTIQNPVYFYMVKMGKPDFSNLKGYVIFAHPQIDALTDNKSISTLTNDKSRKKISSNSWNYASFLPKSSLSFFSKKIKKFSFNYDTGHIDQDPLRRFVSNMVSEDTAYHDLKSDLALNLKSDNFVIIRKAYWQFAFQIFSREYNLKMKLFGGGFNFLNWYGYYFLHDKTASDWPHNPFLSILLYSGILGLLIYCFFLYKVFYYYIKYIEEYPLLFIFFLITFFFSFFSGGSPFDPPIMGFFSILPFFIHAVHKKDKENSEKAISDIKQ
jgi:hypothetical protein